MKMNKEKINICSSCKISHPEVECSGIFYCPNALCKGVGGAWFRYRLDSYKEYSTYHTVDEDEYLEKAMLYNIENNIKTHHDEPKSETP